MGTIKQPVPAKLVMGLIAPSDELIVRVAERLTARYGRIDVWSERVPFSFTAYYEREMGTGLLRQWISFSKPIDPGKLALVKTETNVLEDEFREGKARRVNIDPGYLTLSNLVLASTKDFSHRIYLSGGIYGEVTLIYKGKEFTPLPWTYPDYQSEICLAFLRQVRTIFQGQLQEIRG
jgi:hypothetical protein